MTDAWIGIAAGLLFVAIAAAVTLRARRRVTPPAQILELGDSTSVNRDSGAVRSVQTAEVLLGDAELAAIWTPEHLERLARTYWRFLTRVTLGLIRVHYTERERFVVLLARPLRLLSFHAPEYEMDSSRGLVRWRIARGLLVSRRGRGRGYLQIEVRREPSLQAGRARLHVEIVVANFYPSIASALSRRVYDVTQSRIHVVITHGFLRSLARLDLAPSRTGRFAPGSS
ncbi:MAG: hypothetical protein QOI03_845 [Solirubrobacteraceae bacterium]|jgi:hypothetical protein|nr:hypothetical protein [Solirubrobacteraceae bacterium]